MLQHGYCVCKNTPPTTVPNRDCVEGELCQFNESCGGSGFCKQWGKMKVIFHKISKGSLISNSSWFEISSFILAIIFYQGNKFEFATIWMFYCFGQRGWNGKEIK